MASNNWEWPRRNAAAVADDKADSAQLYRERSGSVRMRNGVAKRTGGRGSEDSEQQNKESERNKSSSNVGELFLEESCR